MQEKTITNNTEFDQKEGETIDREGSITRSTKDSLTEAINFDQVKTRTIDSVDEGINMTGTFGIFQKFVAFILILGYMTGELIVQNMAYLELMPTYECKDKAGVWDTCFPSQFCKADLTY